MSTASTAAPSTGAISPVAQTGVPVHAVARTVARITWANQGVYYPRLHHGALVAALATRNGTSPTLVGFAARGAPRVEIIARTRWQDGQIYGTAEVGHWVVYVDTRPTPKHGGAGWEIRATNVQTRRTTTVARGRDLPPRIDAQGDLAHWAEADRRNHATVFAWRPAFDEARVIGRHLSLASGTETIANGRLYFLGPAAPDAASTRHLGGDSWSIPTDRVSRHARAETHTGLASACSAETSRDGRFYAWSSYVGRHLIVRVVRISTS